MAKSSRRWIGFMPSRTSGSERALMAQCAQALAVAAVDQAGRAGAREPGGGARAGALAAMEAAAAVLHRRLAAGPAGPRAGAAAWGREEVAGAVAVAQPAAVGGRGRG